MRAASSLVHTAVAVQPFAFVARVALPVTVVGKDPIDGAERAGLQSSAGIFGSEGSLVAVSWRWLEDGLFGPEVPMAGQGVRQGVVCWVSFCWRETFVFRPCGVSKAVPMLTALVLPVAR